MKVLYGLEGGRVAFRCPGCKTAHPLIVEGPHAWRFNGDYERPTFEPSVLVKSGHYVTGFEGEDCWCTFEARTGRKTQFECRVCHSFVRDGRIQFLNDCTHDLAGQTVDLPPFDNEAAG